MHVHILCEYVTENQIFESLIFIILQNMYNDDKYMKYYCINIHEMSTTNYQC